MIQPIKYYSDYCTKEFNSLSELVNYLFGIDNEKIKEDIKFLNILLNKQNEQRNI